jgi:hypothetical protein
MGKRRFAALRKTPHVKKLYRVNQSKVLDVIKTKNALEDFDDVMEGVCFALSFTWVWAMLDNSKSSSYELFTARRAKLEHQVHYFEDTKVIELQRAYLALRDGEDISQEDKNWFVDTLVKKRRLTLKTKRDDHIPPSNFRDLTDHVDVLATTMTYVIRQNDLSSAESERSNTLGICVTLETHIDRPGKKPKKVGHTVALFRERQPADAPLYFFDANCGCYKLKGKDEAQKDEAQREFFKRWAAVYDKLWPRFRLQSYFVVTA